MPHLKKPWLVRAAVRAHHLAPDYLQRLPRVYYNRLLLTLDRLWQTNSWLSAEGPLALTFSLAFEGSPRNFQLWGQSFAATCSRWRRILVVLKQANVFHETAIRWFMIAIWLPQPSWRACDRQCQIGDPICFYRHSKRLCLNEFPQASRSGLTKSFSPSSLLNFGWQS